MRESFITTLDLSVLGMFGNNTMFLKQELTYLSIQMAYPHFTRTLILVALE